MLAVIMAVFLALPSIAFAGTTTWTVTYPDGSTETTTDYEEAQKLADTEKLLGTYKTDEEGKILLEKFANNGTIRIYEKEIPTGYTAEDRNTEADLTKDSVTITNIKISGSEDAEDTPPKEDGDTSVQDIQNKTVSLVDSKNAVTSNGHPACVEWTQVDAHTIRLTVLNVPSPPK